MCGPRQLFFQCGPEMPKGSTPLLGFACTGHSVWQGVGRAGFLMLYFLSISVLTQMPWLLINKTDFLAAILTNKQTTIKHKTWKMNEKIFRTYVNGKVSKRVNWNITCKHRLSETKEALDITEADLILFINGKLEPSRVSLPIPVLETELYMRTCWNTDLRSDAVTTSAHSFLPIVQ